MSKRKSARRRRRSRLRYERSKYRLANDPGYSMRPPPASTAEKGDYLGINRSVAPPFDMRSVAPPFDMTPRPITIEGMRELHRQLWENWR